MHHTSAIQICGAQTPSQTTPSSRKPWEVWQTNMRVYGADKVYKQIRRERITAAHCTVERLVKYLGLQGVRRGKVVRATIGDVTAACPLDRVNRWFKADSVN